MPSSHYKLIPQQPLSLNKPQYILEVLPPPILTSFEEEKKINIISLLSSPMMLSILIVIVLGMILKISVDTMSPEELLEMQQMTKKFQSSQFLQDMLSENTEVSQKDDVENIDNNSVINQPDNEPCAKEDLDHFLDSESDQEKSPDDCD